MKRSIAVVFILLGLAWLGTTWQSPSMVPRGLHSNRPSSAGLSALGLRAQRKSASGTGQTGSGVKATALSPDDVSTDFGNLGDLAWLETIARESRAVLVGELHYFGVTMNLRNRIFFGLNKYDSYPVLILENPFSTTAFASHYLSLQDDRAAEEFLASRMCEMISFEEDAALLRHLRRWNGTHPEHRLAVAFSDLEHDFRGTLERVLAPYLRMVDPKIPQKWGAMETRDVEELLPVLRKALDRAASEGLKGTEVFMDPSWARRVLENVESTLYSYNYDFTYYRQKAIVRNLTDPEFLGTLLSSGKVMLFGGKYHFPSRRPYPGDGGFLREGSFLSFLNDSTAGKTHSIMILGGARSLGRMASVDRRDTVYLGANYIDSLDRLLKAVNGGLAGPADPLIENGAGSMANWLFDATAGQGAGPFLVNHIDWESWDTAMAAKGLGRTARAMERDDWEGYETHVFVASSPIAVARVRGRGAKN